jgi:hypothetical protein
LGKYTLWWWLNSFTKAFKTNYFIFQTFLIHIQ